ncbi:peptidase M23 [Pedobacter changchengzhani]|uniref:Peptidase M23 n=1 Tax=Pedobacter changchengzhani TaxID=2529274 RepID=A0A4R5MQQ9_9SPHI|nr:peptidoglycan DD-metalloendopeptidase family protein [Pedobacter changchengzhani]TDG37775.1 peptidase M23 [Pedobacter changchengzhani]
MIDFEKIIQSEASSFHQVVDFDRAEDKIVALTFTTSNTEVNSEILNNTGLFCDWINNQMIKNGARYAMGGYDEHRTIYARSAHFSGAEEPRRLHLGVDIWADAGTPIYNFYDAHVHSFANNDHFGDYGGTIVLTYIIDGFKFNVLYGHLSLASLKGLSDGDFIPKGKLFATFGKPEENGHWPPHVHFQIVINMNNLKGDYPGVCKFSEREKYLQNSPNPALILKYNF